MTLMKVHFSLHSVHRKCGVAALKSLSLISVLSPAMISKHVGSLWALGGCLLLSERKARVLARASSSPLTKRSSGRQAKNNLTMKASILGFTVWRLPGFGVELNDIDVLKDLFCERALRKRWEALQASQKAEPTHMAQWLKGNSKANVSETGDLLCDLHGQILPNSQVNQTAS